MARSNTALVRPKVDPLADVPAYDPALDPELKPLNLEDAKQRLYAYAQELITAPPARVAQLAIDIQRLRVAILLIHEADTGESDPNTQREVAQLTKLLTGQDPGDTDPTDIEDQARHEAAEATLRARNIAPERASKIFKALTAIMDDTPEAYRGGSNSAPRQQRGATH